MLAGPFCVKAVKSTNILSRPRENDPWGHGLALVHLGHVLGQFLHQETAVEHQAVTGLLPPHDLGVKRGKPKVSTAPTGAASGVRGIRYRRPVAKYRATSRGSAGCPKDDGFGVGLKTDLALWIKATFVIKETLNIDHVKEAETGMVIAIPHQFHGKAFAARRFQRNRAERRQGVKHAHLATSCRRVAQNAKIFTPVDDQLGRSDQQRETRRPRNSAPETCRTSGAGGAAISVRKKS
jgi:hypothetical protein